MELRHLRYFVAVAEELNVTRAARRLHVSQPPLSRQIHDLENEVGAALFARDRRGVQLTEAGRFFLEEARAILAHSERAVRRVRAAADGEAGHLAVAYTSTSLDPILSRTLRLFRQRFPLVELEIRDQSTYQQVEALLERKIDLGYAVIRLPEFEKDLVFECVRRTAVWVALPPGHPLTKRRRLALRDLGGENFLQLRQVPAAFREWMLNIFRPAGFTPRIIQQAEDVHSLFGLVSAGVGIAIVPEITRRLTPVEVEFRPLPATTPKFEFHIFWRRDNNSPILQNFLKLFREQLGSATARRLR